MTPQKRLLDLTLALVIAAVLALPFAVLVLVLLIREGRPVFYVSERMQAPGRPFQLWKLRTMTVVQSDSGVSGGDKSARITATGRLLRRARLDEIPQLWNVLCGDMSLVGPRPMMTSQRSLYPGQAYYALRPGITGPWQVSARNKSGFADRARYDADYLAQVSFLTDLRLLAATVRVVLRSTGC